MKIILVIGGTGAQGSAVVRALAASGQYRVLLFTRDPESRHSKELTQLPDVEAVLNPATVGYDLDAFEDAAKTAQGVFINTDGFSMGELAETYWGIRLYESCIKTGVAHVVYSGLDDAYRDSGYDRSKYVTHFQGPARVQAFIKSQPQSQTAWTITRTGPYIEMLAEAFKPRVDSNGVYNFTFPLEDGAVVYIHLEDYGRCVQWIFEHPAESVGQNIGIGIAHITGDDLATAFTAVTGKPAVYRSVPAADWARMAFSRFPDGADSKVGYRSTSDQSTLTLTYAENFTNFFNLWKASKGNEGLIRRDYALLDKILPGRVRSAKEWMEKAGYTGEAKAVLKNFVNE